ncbi:MAG TPA: phospholipase D family protein [Burkholderiaceae bacterium]|nr:phospholipase D family protein [Burkholderiaceae bacterium]
MRMLLTGALLLAAGAAAWLWLAHMQRLPIWTVPPSPPVAAAGFATTRLAQAIDPLIRQHPGRSGIFPLHDGLDAFAARALLADAAERTLDVQYYIWRNDLSGTLLTEALHRAAERGVHVRLLLDDNNTGGLDSALAALDAHPNVEVRLFNPFAQRRWRVLGYLTDFARLNRRMHNKSLTADRQATIVGGRNVGDEYFNASASIGFVDLDVLAVGPVVEAVSNDFERYWNSASSYPVAMLLPAAHAADTAALATRASVVERNPAAHDFVAALSRSPFVQRLLRRELPFEWAHVRMLSDDPAKGLGQAPPEAQVAQRLATVLGGAAHEVQLVSPYFVPTGEGVAALSALAARGVQISVLTNALEATDVVPVHAGYAKYRKTLLQAGIRLFEMKRDGAVPAHGLLGMSGSSASSLHAKTFAVDGERVFVGSFNFDPRSANLNTEMGFLIDSPVLAQGMRAAFDTSVPVLSYEVRRDPEGHLQWLEHRRHLDDAVPVAYAHEPGATWWKRMAVWVVGKLPVEWLL